MHRPVSYTSGNYLQRRDGENFADEFSREIGNMSRRCIDIGSGTCDVAVDFILSKLEPNATLVCSDISEAMVDHGKKRYGDNDRLSFIKLDIETENLPENLIGQFDHVTSFYCLHWCYDLRQPFENIYRLLRPEGTVFLTFIASCISLDAFTALQAMPKYQAYAKGVHNVIPIFQYTDRPRQKLITILTDAGFQIQTCSHRTMNYVFETQNHLRDFLLALSPFDMDLMSHDLREEFARDLMREVEEREIVFNENQCDEGNYSVMLRYSVCIAYLKKAPVN